MGQATLVRSLADAADIGGRGARHFERVFRTLATPQGGEARDEWFRWITREPHPLGNMVIQSTPATAEGVHQSIAPLVADHLPSAVLFPSGASSAAREALAAAGYAGGGRMPVMAIDIGRLATTALPRGYDFVRIAAQPHGDAWADALATGYGLPAGLTRRLSPVAVGADDADDAQTQFFAVLRDGHVVATSMLFLADGVAGIYSVATLAHERGQGLGAHATAAPLRVAQRLGYRVGILQSSQAGYPVYVRLGFVDVGEVPIFLRMPQA